jgi:hypothetical protein
MALGLGGSIGHKRLSSSSIVTTSQIPNRVKLIDYCLKTGAAQDEIASGIGISIDAIRSYVYGRRMATTAIANIDAAIPMLDGLITLNSCTSERARNTSRHGMRELLGNVLDIVDAKHIHVDDYDRLNKLVERTKHIPVPKATPVHVPDPAPARPPVAKQIDHCKCGAVEVPVYGGTVDGHIGAKNTSGLWCAPVQAPKPTPPVAEVTPRPPFQAAPAPVAPQYQFMDIEGLIAFFRSTPRNRFVIERVGVMKGEPLFAVTG